MHWLAPTGVGLAALVVFTWTLAPTVTAEDSGELIAAAWHFGIPHPPGYPLWTMLCGTFIHLVPIDVVAYRANLFSALCSSGAAMVAYAALREMRLTRIAAAAGALVWIWSRASWSRSVITEVYGLNLLLTATLLWCGLRWRNTGESRVLVWACLFFGVGMSNHYTIALPTLALLVWILVHRFGLVLKWKLVLISIGAFALGFLPYLFLPIRAAARPPMCWGDASTWDGFVAIVTRERYDSIGPLKVDEPRSLERFGQQLSYLGKFIVDDMTPWLTCVAAFGVFVMARRDRRVLFLVFLWLLATGVSYAVLVNYDFDVVSQWVSHDYLIPMMLGVAIPIAFALQWSLDACRRAFEGAPLLRLGGIVCVGIVPPGVQLVSHWRHCDYSNYQYALDHARNLLLCMEPNAIVFPRSDHSAFSLAYLTMVEGHRPDVLIADIRGRIGPEPLAEGRHEPDVLAARLIRDRSRPVYFTDKTDWPSVNASLVPAGPLYRLLRANETFDRKGLLATCYYQNWEHPSVMDVGARRILGEYEFFAALDALEDRRIRVALDRFDKAASLSPLSKEICNSIAIALAQHKFFSEAIAYFEKSAELAPRYLVPRQNLAKLYQNQGRTLEAKRQLEEIIKLSPQDFWAYRQLGDLYASRLGDPEQADYFWRESLKRYPNQPDVKARLEELVQE